MKKTLDRYFEEVAEGIDCRMRLFVPASPEESMIVLLCWIPRPPAELLEPFLSEVTAGFREGVLQLGDSYDLENFSLGGASRPASGRANRADPVRQPAGQFSPLAAARSGSSRRPDRRKPRRPSFRGNHSDTRIWGERACLGRFLKILDLRRYSSAEVRTQRND